MTTSLIRTGAIEVGNRLRDLQPDMVDKIAESIKEGQLLQPIVIRPKKGGGGYILVFGRHRFEAERKLGHKTILCRIVKMTDDEALLSEIDENLCRADLTAAERAKHTRERKKIFEAAHPETKRGSGGGRAKAAKAKGAKGQVGPKQDAYVEDTAKKTGKSRRTVKRDVTRSKIDPQAIDDLAGTCLDTGVELDAMAKLSPDEQRDLAARAKAGETVTAVKPKAGKAKPKPKVAGNGADPDESATKMKEAHAANEEASATKPKPTPSKSEKALAQFKVACDHWLPQLDRGDLAKAAEYANNIYCEAVKAAGGFDKPVDHVEPADTAAPEYGA